MKVLRKDWVPKLIVLNAERSAWGAPRQLSILGHALCDDSAILVPRGRYLAVIGGQFVEIG
jgi:hypothetical protein